MPQNLVPSGAWAVLYYERAGYLRRFTFTTNEAVAATIAIKDGATGATVWTGAVPASSTEEFEFGDSPIAVFSGLYLEASAPGYAWLDFR